MVGSVVTGGGGGAVLSTMVEVDAASSFIVDRAFSSPLTMELKELNAPGMLEMFSCGILGSGETRQGPRHSRW